MTMIREPDNVNTSHVASPSELGQTEQQEEPTVVLIDCMIQYLIWTGKAHIELNSWRLEMSM